MATKKKTVMKAVKKDVLTSDAPVVTKPGTKLCSCTQFGTCGSLAQPGKPYCAHCELHTELASGA
jgi:hypothetical protein